MPIANLATNSKAPLVKSINPPVGRMKRPTKPRPVPLKNPKAPSSVTPKRIHYV